MYGPARKGGSVNIWFRVKRMLQFYCSARTERSVSFIVPPDRRFRQNQNASRRRFLFPAVLPGVPGLPERGRGPYPQGIFGGYHKQFPPDGQVPLHYVIQCLHYMIVTGKKTWYIAGLIFGKEFVYRKISYDPILAEQLKNIEADFWNNNVVKRKMPDPDGSKVYDDILQKYFKTAKKGSTVELAGFDEKLMQRERLSAQISELTAAQKAIEQEIKLFMKDSELAVSEKYRVSWGNVNTTRLDTKKLKEEHPDIYEKYARRSQSRRFEVRAA